MACVATSRLWAPPSSACLRWTQVGAVRDGCWAVGGGLVVEVLRGVQGRAPLAAGCVQCPPYSYKLPAPAPVPLSCQAGGYGPKLESWAFGTDQDGLEALLRDGVFHLHTCKLCDDGVVVKGALGRVGLGVYVWGSGGRSQWLGGGCNGHTCKLCDDSVVVKGAPCGAAVAVGCAGACLGRVQWLHTC